MQNLSNITEIDETKSEIEKLRIQQISVIDKLIQVLNKIIEIKRIEIEYKAELYDILSLLTYDDTRDDTLDDDTKQKKNILGKIIITEKNKKKLHFGKFDEFINTIKETSENNDFFKFVIQYLNNNDYNGKDMERVVLTGVYYDIQEEENKINSELKLVKKLVKKLVEMKENSGGSIHKKQRRTRRKPNKKNKLKRKINKSKKHY